MAAVMHMHVAMRNSLDFQCTAKYADQYVHTKLLLTVLATSVMQ